LLKGVKPKPVFLLAGERDPIVPFQGQMLSVNYIRRLFEIDPQKTVTAGHASYEYGKQSELVAYLHPGGHEVPDAALPLMVKFFQSHAAK
jgi:polyhydroxybutyrate depolymerase